MLLFQTSQALLIWNQLCKTAAITDIVQRFIINERTVMWTKCYYQQHKPILTSISASVLSE